MFSLARDHIYERDGDAVTLGLAMKFCFSFECAINMIYSCLWHLISYSKWSKRWHAL